jgi:predicted nucleic acid-binding protein
VAGQTAVLDACVLFTGGARDFLLWVAEAGAFSPAWSDAIHEEWMRSRRNKFGDPESRLKHARAEMEKAFPGANFDPDPETLKSIATPDKNDAHVIATAIAAQATTVVTYNGRHFPDRMLAPLGLRAVTPDAFCARLFGEVQDDVIEGARLHRTSLNRPSYDPVTYLDHLVSLRFPRTAELLRGHDGLI